MVIPIRNVARASGGSGQATFVMELFSLPGGIIIESDDLPSSGERRRVAAAHSRRRRAGFPGSLWQAAGGAVPVRAAYERIGFPGGRHHSGGLSRFITRRLRI